MDDGGDGERLAPVIPLFGGAAPEPPARPRRSVPAPEPVWHASWVAPDGSADGEGGRNAASRATSAAAAGHEPDGAPFPFISSSDAAAAASGGAAADDGSADRDEVRAAAEQTLVRRLRTRQLSIAEARTVLRESGLDAGDADELLEAFIRRGYLDDAALADQLVYAAVERKGQGRGAIGPLLAKRGIPRDVTDAALDALPDDEAERALEFARSKARSLGSRDRETALRRLMGQLARRGYPSSVSLSAARQALDENGTRPPSLGSTRGVTFD